MRGQTQAEIATEQLKKKRRRKILDYTQMDLYPEDVEKLFTVCTNLRDKAMMMLSYYAPCLRRMEVVNMKIEDINWSDGYVVLSTYKGMKRYHKSNADLTQPIDDRTMQLLRLVKGNRNEGYLFLSNRGKRMTVENYSDICKRWGLRCGVRIITPPYETEYVDKNGKIKKYARYKFLHPHLLRHAGGRKLKKLLGSDFARTILRHSSISLVDNTYGVLSVIDRKKMYEHAVRRDIVGDKHEELPAL